MISIPFIVPSLKTNKNEMIDKFRRESDLKMLPVLVNGLKENELVCCLKISFSSVIFHLTVQKL